MLPVYKNSLKCPSLDNWPIKIDTSGNITLVYFLNFWILKILVQPIVIWIRVFEDWAKLKIYSDILPPLMAIVNCDKTWRSQGEKTKQTLNFKKSILPLLSYLGLRVVEYSWNVDFILFYQAHEYGNLNLVKEV